MKPPDLIPKRPHHNIHKYSYVFETRLAGGTQSYGLQHPPYGLSGRSATNHPFWFQD
jgi:hypothetical protein